MNYIIQWRLRKKRGKAMTRLDRMRAFNDIIQRLGGHRGGKTFMVDTSNLKMDPPSLLVTERFSLLRLSYAYCIASICMYHRRKFEIAYDEEKLTYIIY